MATVNLAKAMYMLEIAGKLATAGHAEPLTLYERELIDEAWNKAIRYDTIALLILADRISAKCRPF